MERKGMIAEHKEVLERLAELIRKEEDCVAQIYSRPERQAELKEKFAIARKKTGEEFIVLVMGIFSSGKSSMINALIGEDLLPTGALPETAIIAELRYGEKKRITMYPKKGHWEGGDDPFDLKEVTSEEIARYASLTDDAALNVMEETAMGYESDKKIESKFDKMVIYWPLKMLEDGVVIVDSPGINDPYSSEKVVNDYLPQADAIVYLMSSLQGYTETDRSKLKEMNDVKWRDIVTGYTYYDAFSMGKKPQQIEKTRKVLVAHMMQHTDLGEESVHFLNSMEGLAGKLEGNAEKWRHSGFEGLEKFLGQYLVNGKGKTQVRNMATTIIRQAEAMAKEAGELNQAMAQDVNELGKKIRDAETQLRIIRRNSYETGRTYRMRLENCLPKAESMIREAVKGLPEAIDLEGFEPETEFPSGGKKLWPFGEEGARKRAKAIQEECQNEINRRMNTAYKKWASEVLEEYLKSAVEESSQAIQPDLQQIAKDLTGVRDAVTGNVHQGDGTVGNLAVGLAYGLLTGDWFTGGMSAVYGKGAMVRGILFQAGAGVGLGLLASAGVAISFPVVAIASIGASIWAVLTEDNKKKVEKIKIESVKAVRKAYASGGAAEEIEKTVEETLRIVHDYIDGAGRDMEVALQQDIENTESELKQMIDESILSQNEKDRQRKNRDAAVESLVKIRGEAEKICREYGIDVVVPKKI